jgi:hypothetical protein
LPARIAWYPQQFPPVKRHFSRAFDVLVSLQDVLAEPVQGDIDKFELCTTDRTSAEAVLLCIATIRSPYCALIAAKKISRNCVRPNGVPFFTP